MCSKIHHTEIPHHVTTRQLNRSKIQITGFNKMGDTKAGNLKADSNKN